VAPRQLILSSEGDQAGKMCLGNWYRVKSDQTDTDETIDS